MTTLLKHVADIMALEAWRDTIKQRSKVTEKRRKS